VLITAVIPTKNRPHDLARAVASVRDQQRLPDELLIVDQSPDEASRAAVEAALDGSALRARMNYVLDSSIAGLVPAKAEAARRASGDVVCFLEDDVVLEPDYLLQVEQGFLETPGMLGCCGVVSNLPPLPPGYVRLFHFFHRGIFHDTRVGVHGAARDTLPPLIPSTCLSGGLSAYRREVFVAVPFDIANELFLIEDIDFSTRAAARFGSRFFINSRARLEHRPLSPLNRTVLGLRQRRKLREFLVFYKKRRDERHAGAALLLLLAGLLLESAYDALRAAHYAPVLGYFLGLWDGMRWKLAEPTVT